MFDVNMNSLLDEIENDALSKTASAEDDPMMKVAKDLFASGQMFARGFAAQLRKEAAEGGLVEPSNGDAGNDKSVFKDVAKAIQSRQGAGPASPEIGSSGTGGVGDKKIKGENPGVTYDKLAPKQQQNPVHERPGNIG